MQDVSTRWNSIIYYMLQKLIQRNLNKLTNSPQTLGAECLLTFKEILELFKPFEDGTVQLSRDTYILLRYLLFELC